LPPELTVVGSINIDLVARVERLPKPGETVGGGEFDRFPGGKGANQAVAAARLGADVRLVGRVGADAFALDAVEAEGVDVTAVSRDDGESGVALIFVDAEGENVIVVAPGANSRLEPQPVSGAVLCQLEIPNEAVLAAAREASFFCLNAAPARPIDVEPDLLVVNRHEYETVSRGKLVALTLGEEGAVLFQDGQEITRATPPRVKAVDGTAAGDAFTACLVVSHLEGREWDEALTRGCAAGALAASRLGAQPSLPTAKEVDEILAA
jgi:ribokinase